MFSLQGHTKRIWSIAWDGLGKLLASGSWDQTARVWDVGTGREVLCLTEHETDVFGVALTPDGGRLASSGRGGTIRLWDVKMGKELLLLVPLDGKDWVAVTPDGRFDGTQDGLRSLHWVQDRQVIPLDAFHESYYTPKLLASIWAGERAREPMQRLRLPPTVRIAEPLDGAIMHQRQVVVNVEATDRGGGVDDVRLYHNGKRVPGLTRGSLILPSGEYQHPVTQSYELTLLPGRNHRAGSDRNK